MFFSIDTKSQEYENVELLYHWSEDSLVGSESFDNVYNEIWGITNNGREYAIIGSTAGTHFFDLTESNSISEVAFVAGKVQGSEIIHRDYHDFKNLLYAVSDEGQSSLQIIDFSTLPDSVSLVYDSSELFQRSHNIFIDTATAKLYSTNGDIYSLENPLDPTLIYNTSLLSCHDMYVQNDTAYINGGYDGFFIVDFSQTTPENQYHQVLGSLPTYPDQGYNHSGWLTADGNYYVMADETWGMRMKMLDLSDFSNIEVISLFGSEVDSNSIPHNQIIRGDYLYTAYYHDGLYVHDISEPSQPILLAYYDTFLPNHHDSYMGAWGVYPFLPSGKILLSDMQTGLYVFTVTYDNPLNMEANFSNDISLFPNPANDFLTIANTHFIYNSMQLIDINGKSVFKSDLIHQNHKLDISKYSPGIYSLRLRGKHKSKSFKLIIE
ncbi:MAG: choice-of-anchor B family protein [Flavobacteriales bacterium]